MSHGPEASEGQRYLFAAKEAANCPIPETVTVYASGTNRVADIKGAVLAGVPIAVDVSKLSQRAIDEIIRNSLPVLLDSGAFGEVAIRDGRPTVVAPISHQEWERRLNIYLRIAQAFRKHAPKRNSIAQVTAVAPDRVGSQEVTMARLSEFRATIRKVQAIGADILVPLQIGRLTLAKFYEHAANILGIEIVPGMPMKKSATTPAGILEFVRQTRPRRLHLLGMGITNRVAEPLIRLLQHEQPSLRISLDSNRIRAGVGRRRIITKKERLYSDELEEGWTGELDLRRWSGEAHDFTELIFHPSWWLSKTKLQEFSDSLTWLSEDQRRLFVTDPEMFLADEQNLNDWTYQALMKEYHAYIAQRTRSSARTRAVFESLDDSKLGGQTLVRQ